MSDGFRLKALGILLGSMRYGVACGSHCIVWRVLASLGTEEGGGLRVVVKEGVKDRVGEDGVFVVELVVKFLNSNLLNSFPYNAYCQLQYISICLQSYSVSHTLAFCKLGL